MRVTGSIHTRLLAYLGTVVLLASACGSTSSQTASSPDSSSQSSLGELRADPTANEQPSASSDAEPSSQSEGSPATNPSTPAATNPEPPQKIAVPAALSWTGNDLAGNPINAAEFAGQDVLLWFWAPW